MGLLVVHKMNMLQWTYYENNTIRLLIVWYFKQFMRFDSDLNHKNSWIIKFLKTESQKIVWPFFKSMKLLINSTFWSIQKIFFSFILSILSIKHIWVFKQQSTVLVKIKIKLLDLSKPSGIKTILLLYVQLININ